MAKYRVNIGIVERYSNAACIEADSPEDAERKIRNEIGKYDYLYNAVVDNLNDQEISVECEGIVMDEEEAECLINID